MNNNTTENFKECKKCVEILPQNNFRNNRKICKKCIYKQEEQYRLNYFKNYYNKHKEIIIERSKEYFKLHKPVSTGNIGRPRTTGTGYRQYKENIKDKTFILL
jgi:hypothetical protein